MIKQQRHLYIDFTNPQLFWNDLNKCIITILLLIVFLGCNKSSNKIKGTWTYIKTIENRNLIRSAKQDGIRQIQCLASGEMKLFHNNKRYGLGLYYYKLKGDSLYLTNVQVDKSGKFDTLGTQAAMLTLKNDTMIIKQVSYTSYYKREKN